jgi:uncharacterized protein YhbP (UPF0306 family)
MIKDLSHLAKEIIENNQYMSLATVDKDNEPWISPVAYAYDDKWNFYFVTIPSSKHGLNFNINNHIVAAIFDSRQNLGEGVGLQIEGIVEDVGIHHIPTALSIMYNRKYPFGSMASTFAKGLKKLLQKKLYHCYRFVPAKIWMNDPNSNIDERVQVYLDK